jgi:hypothetical protein
VGEFVRYPYRFRGLDGVALGGYVCGSLARRVAGPVGVGLRRPPPLERDLEIVEVADDGWELRDGDVVVAAAAPTRLQIEVRDPVDLDRASEATRGFPYVARHPRPGCVVCSPTRVDGLGIFPGRVGGSDLVAAVWNPDESLPTDGGVVALEVVWSALDCPTYFGAAPAGDVDSVLARLSAHVLRPVRVGQGYAILSWPISVDGRKRLAGVALWSEAGQLCAIGHGLWIERPRPPRASDEEP